MHYKDDNTKTCYVQLAIVTVLEHWTMIVIRSVVNVIAVQKPMADNVMNVNQDSGIILIVNVVIVMDCRICAIQRLVSVSIAVIIRPARIVMNVLQDIMVIH